jgi:hypothetical protein
VFQQPARLRLGRTQRLQVPNKFRLEKCHLPAECCV